MPSSESAESIAEVLQHIRQLVLQWDPSLVICDKDDAELNAIAMVFPKATILLCDFHMKQAWDRWLKTASHGVAKEDQNKVYAQMVFISMAPTVKACELRCKEFEQETFYIGNRNLESMFSHTLTRSTEWHKSEIMCPLDKFWPPTTLSKL
ncbi:hypothetical protein CYMTET_46712 [Cymbomonas tetramitiformis]|uniref:MULE transposase domain-containing protein n=1 Tax=Cymbomonas tetramitiformis TaxID=36881 RepID=A0AAE0BWU5_9CHLO|nr:hypothetical protein CYMTET_46712 [Cymbomonas tetramitiformis]